MPRNRWLALAGVAAVLVAIGAAALGRELVNSDSSPKPASKSRAFVKFRDPQAGLSLSYPRRWRKLPSADGQVKLLVAGGGASLLVRIAELGVRVKPDSLASARKLTNRLVKATKNAKLLRPAQRVELGGLPGYLYLYTFKDLGSGQRGAHAHYFLFRGSNMITLVFQALPSTAFSGLVPLFDRIARTFRGTPSAARQ